MSEAHRVKVFTEESGANIPSKPELMTKTEASFLAKMVLDEVMELLATVMPPKEAKMALIEMICSSKDIDIQFERIPEIKLIAEQADAGVDINYYILNAFAKKGINLSKVFDIVHEANMNKKDPKTGKFLKRADGKIIKPDNWKAPDITSEMIRQQMHGPFNL